MRKDSSCNSCNAPKSSRCFIPQVKSLNYLNNILVRIEAKLAGVQEALMLNDQGYVAEGSGDNVFIVKGNKLITPPSSAGALEGITRNAILEIGENLGMT